MMEKITFILLGLALGICGVGVIVNPVYYSGRLDYTWDFTDVKWVFGGFLIIIGIALILTTLRKKKENGEVDK